MNYELKFDPRTIEHLGVKMYSTLPPALAELISNSYDADANEVKVTFHEQNGSPISITIKDNGCGMNVQDIQERFLVIGRNRRLDDGDNPSTKYGRLPTGKKGLGKLALFGLAKKIILDTTKNKKRNRFELDWDKLIASDKVYSPSADIEDKLVNKNDGTVITLRELKRKTAFDLELLADSLSKIFIVDDTFKIILTKTDGEIIEVTNERRYGQIEQEFSWGKLDIECGEFEFIDGVELNLITGKTPIKPSSGLRGITIFSRGKLVNVPEYFSNSTSSHFYQYLTGWIKADFIDLLDEDVISTNRQSINWENETMTEFRDWLSDFISKVGISWREKRKNKKDDEFKDKTGIDKEKWFSTLPDEIKDSAEKIVGTLSDDEGVDESFNPIVTALHEIIPDYPNLHWRHLHHEIQEASNNGYTNEDYYTAFLEAIKRYANRVREYSSNNNGHDLDLMGQVFGSEPDKVLKVAMGYLRANGTDFADNTIKNIEGAQRKLSQGVVEGGRNVVAHEESIDLSISGLFSEKDCLDLLSLISHLMYRIEKANKKKCLSR
ncbi:MAG: TIGR02391 family protein [Chlorobi bacterium]|nr:TIGR02391 family protein [Chlorobiota bacterium]